MRLYAYHTYVYFYVVSFLAHLLNTMFFPFIKFPHFNFMNYEIRINKVVVAAVQLLWGICVTQVEGCHLFGGRTCIDYTECSGLCHKSGLGVSCGNRVETGRD